MSKPVIMGRKTYESIGRALPGRHNIVVSRNSDYRLEGVSTVTSIEAALAIADADEVMIIGGGQLYQSLLPRADRLYLTLVDAALEGDTCFPDYTQYDWQQLACGSHPADDKNPYSMTFVTLERQR